jgi:ATP-dependent helicase/nuclease subunit A
MTTAHRILLASAGTGKTYQLVHRVLGLLLSGASLDGVVATTFTRKAAGQILERVLERLAEAVSDADAREDVRRELGRDALERDECLALLGRLLRSIHAARVSTLDAWFVQAVSLQELELGLPPGWALAAEDEDAVMRAAAVSRLVRETDDEHLANLLADVRGRARATSRGVHQAVLDVVTEGHDLLRAAAPAAWGVWQPPEPTPEAEVHDALIQLEQWPLPVKKTDGQPVKAWVDARDAIVEAVQSALAGETPDTALLGKGLLKKVADGETTYSRHPITTELRAVLAPCAALLAAPVLEAIARRTRSRHELLVAFAERYDEAKGVARRYRFDDLPRLLAGAGGGAGAGVDDSAGASAGVSADTGLATSTSTDPTASGLASDTLAFRGLGRVEHLLLDEFQDTSLPQWLVVEPLVRTLAADRSGGRSLFCVGDTKQSIYGWRGGEPRLLEELGEALEVAPETLVHNYRSAPVVLAAASAVLSSVSSWPALDKEPSLRKAARDWDDAWPEHVAAQADLPGRVSVWEAGDPAASTAKRFEAVLERAADLAAEAAAQAPEGTIGVLVRSNKAIPRLLHALRRRGVAASGEGGNPVTDAEAVQLALSALHLADHPGDGLARLHVATSPFGKALGLERHDDDRAAHRFARRIRRELVEHGYGEVLTRWQREIVEAPGASESGGDTEGEGATEPTAAFGPWDRRRFAQLVEQATAWEPRAGLRPSAFVSAARAARVEDADASRVKVMTLHAAKGLEFHAVVLPELHGRTRVTESSVLVGHADPLARPDTVVTGARKEEVGFDEGLTALAHQTWARAFGETLCVLYVGLTRAMRRLDIVLPPGSKSGDSLVLSELVRARLVVGGGGGGGEEMEDGEEPGLLWRAPGSVEDWAAGIAAEADPGKAAEGFAEPAPSLVMPVAPSPRALVSRSPSSMEGGATDRGHDLLEPRTTGALDRGTALHFWLEQVEWLDGFDATDADLLARARARGLDHPELEAWLAEFRAALVRPEIVGLLTEPTDGLSREVRNERDFALRLDDDGSGPCLLSGSMDRLVITRQAGQITALDIIDWKSDAAADDDALQQRIAYYTPQLQSYHRAAASLFGTSEGVITCQLAFVAPGRVVPLPADP